MRTDWLFARSLLFLGNSKMLSLNGRSFCEELTSAVVLMEVSGGDEEAESHDE